MIEIRNRNETIIIAGALIFMFIAGIVTEYYIKDCSTKERIIETTKNVCEHANVTVPDCECKCLTPKCEEPGFQYCIDKIKEVDNFRKALNR